MRMRRRKIEEGKRRQEVVCQGRAFARSFDLTSASRLKEFERLVRHARRATHPLRHFAKPSKPFVVSDN